MSSKPIHSTTHKDSNYLTGQDRYHTIISQDNGWFKPTTIRGEGHGTSSEQSQENASDDYDRNKLNK